MENSSSEFIHQIRRCLRPGCRFRYPVIPGKDDAVLCPRCGGPTGLVDSPYPTLRIKNQPVDPRAPALEVLVDNLRSAFNIGSIFRTADGAGVRHIHLCGITPTPDHPKINKTALGAEFAIPWSQSWDSVKTAAELKASGMQLWALEGGEESHSLFDRHPGPASPPILLIIGNEISGVDPGVLSICDQIVRIPMQGTKESLNVSTAFAIAIYYLRFLSWRVSDSYGL